jgi:hypothetical protein
MIGVDKLDYPYACLLAIRVCFKSIDVLLVPHPVLIERCRKVAEAFFT